VHFYRFILNLSAVFQDLAASSRAILIQYVSIEILAVVTVANLYHFIFAEVQTG